MAKFFLFNVPIKTSITPLSGVSFHGGPDRERLGTIHAPGGSELKWDGVGPPMLRIPLGITGRRFHLLAAYDAMVDAQLGNFGLRWEKAGEEVAA